MFLPSINRKFGIAAFVVTTLIAFGRMYMFLHYPTDVLCGIVFGIILPLPLIVMRHKSLEKKYRVS